MIAIKNIISAGHTIYLMEMLSMVITSFGAPGISMFAQSNQLLHMQHSNVYSVRLLKLLLKIHLISM